MGRVVQRRTIAAGQLLLDLLVGARCAGCGSSARTSPCPRCERTLDAAPATVDAAWVGDGPARRLVLAAKLGTWRGGATWFAGRLVQRGLVADVDAVTWVPADRRRRARRGGCLPERCARRVARRIDVPAVPLLRRLRSRSQRGLDRAGRRANVREAFEALPQGKMALPPGSRVLLVDDVRTTGATLAAARSELERLGLRVRTVAILAAEAARPAAGVGARPVSLPMTGAAKLPQRARNPRSRHGLHMPIRWDHVRRKGSTRS